MAVPTLPPVMAKFWACTNSSTRGTVNAISSTSVVPLASWDDGFNMLNMTPIELGGVPPAGGDMNGVLQLLTKQGVWANAGGLYPFQSQLSSAWGGYPQGAVLIDTALTSAYISLVDGNTYNFNTDPSSIGTKWAPFGGAAIRTEHPITSLGGVFDFYVSAPPPENPMYAYALTNGQVLDAADCAATVPLDTVLDSGEFLTAYTNLPVSPDWLATVRGVAVGAGKIVVFASVNLTTRGPVVFYSTDHGANWTQVDLPRPTGYPAGSTIVIQDMIWTGAQFFAVINGGATYGAFYYESSDGITWTNRLQGLTPLPGDTYVMQPVKIMATDGDGKILMESYDYQHSYYSADHGATWAWGAFGYAGISGTSNSACYDITNSRWILLQNDSDAVYLETSPNGTTWTISSGALHAVGLAKGIYCRNDYYWAICGYGLYYAPAILGPWTLIDNNNVLAPNGSSLASRMVAFTPHRAVLCTNAAYCYSIVDGSFWLTKRARTSVSLTFLAYDGTKLLGFSAATGGVYYIGNSATYDETDLVMPDFTNPDSRFQRWMRVK